MIYSKEGFLEVMMKIDQEMGRERTRGEDMKIYKWFSIPWVIFLFCILTSAPAFAQGNYTAIYKKVSPSVVTILTYVEELGSFFKASGFFVNQEGDVVTNYHVLENASYAAVETANGRVHRVKNILAINKQCDLILISVDILSDVVHPLPMSSTIPKVGESIIVIGNPLGLEMSLSPGFVSGFREIAPYGRVIQITAPITKTSSGSPVLNMKGEVIGVASFKAVEGQNINFAIPGERVVNLKTEKGQIISEWGKSKKEERVASAEELYTAGLQFYRARDYNEALSYFKESLKKNFRDYETYYFIGNCEDELGRYQEAVEAYKQAIGIKHDFQEAYYNLAGVYLALGRYDEAIEAYEKAIKIKPDDVAAYYNLGKVYLALGRNKEAIEAYEKAIKIKPDAAAYINLGVAYRRSGRHNEAIEAYKKAVKIKPDDADAYYNLGGVYLMVGNKSMAIEQYKILKDLDPSKATKLYDLIYK